MRIVNTQTHLWTIISFGLCCQATAAVIGRLEAVCLCED